MFKRTSLLPLPKPLITGPDRRIGKGSCGPESGPVVEGRVVAGILVCL